MTSSANPSAAAVDREPVPAMAWFSIESCMVYLLCAGFAGRSDRRAGVAVAVVGGEPTWFAHDLPAVHAPLLVLAVCLHGRNLRRARRR